MNTILVYGTTGSQGKPSAGGGNPPDRPVPARTIPDAAREAAQPHA